MKDSVEVFVFFYNQERFVQERLDSIRRQSVPISKITIVNDASTDETGKRIIDYLSAQSTDFRVITNLVFTNQASGRPGARWLIAKNAQADFVWFAEGDDSCEPNFLEESLAGLKST